MGGDGGDARAAPDAVHAARRRTLGTIALAAVAAFLGVATAMHVVRADLDGARAPLSLYLLGPQGLWLKGAYVGLAGALPLLGLGARSALQPAARSAAPVLLFALAGVGLVVTALAHTDLVHRAATFEGWVHQVAAQTTFLCVTTAMILHSLRLRLDPAWRARFPLALGLALAAFAWLWVHALWREPPRGLMQKSVIGLILAWLALVAAWLRRSPARDLRH